MPIPLLAVASAIAAGGTLVPHAAGGMIVTAATGYVAGTYLSTAAIASVLAAATATLGVGATVLAGAASAVIGSAGIFGTTIGATGLTGVLMAAGVLPSTPIAVPIAIGAAGVAAGYASYVLLRFHRKLRAAKNGEEAHFTEREAKIISALVRRLSRNAPSA